MTKARERERERAVGVWGLGVGKSGRYVLIPFLFLSVLGKWNGIFVTALLVKKGPRGCVLSIDSRTERRKTGTVRCLQATLPPYPMFLEVFGSVHGPPYNILYPSTSITLATPLAHAHAPALFYCHISLPQSSPPFSNSNSNSRI